MLDSELLSECPGLEIILLYLRDVRCLSQPGSSLCFFLGKYWNVSLRNVVISSSTKHASIFRAYGQFVPLGFTVSGTQTSKINIQWYKVKANVYKVLLSYFMLKMANIIAMHGGNSWIQTCSNPQCFLFNFYCNDVHNIEVYRKTNNWCQ